MLRPFVLVAFASLFASALAACSDSGDGQSGGSSSGGSSSGGAAAGGGGAGGSSCDPSPIVERVDVGEVELEVMTEGCGPALVLLHGFPEFAFTWDPIAADLAQSFRVTRPNMRGYPPSDVPTDVASYEVSHLVDDVVGLIAATGEEKVILVSHDWGGIVGWTVAMQHPELLRGFVVLNAPPPGVWGAEVQLEPQKSASSYVNFFLADGAEDLLAANDFSLLHSAFGGVLTAEQTAQYSEAWGRPGMLTGGLAYYHANLENGPLPKSALPMDSPVDVPVLVLWGDADEALLGDVLLDDLDALVPDLTVRHYPDAAHFIMYDEPQAIIDEISAFAASL